MKPTREKQAIIALSICLIISLCFNVCGVGYLYVQGRTEKKPITWIPTVYAPDIDSVSSESSKLTASADTEMDAEEELIAAEAEEGEKESTEASQKAVDALPDPTAEPTPTEAPTEKTTPTEKPSIRYNGATVYVTKTGTKFHREDCSSLSKSKIAISFEEACAKMYEPCGKCKP